MLRVFIHREPWSIGRELKEHAARFLEVNRLEPEAIDHRGRMLATAGDGCADFRLVRIVIHAPREMMNAAGAPRAATRAGKLANVDILARFSFPYPAANPAVLGADL